MAPRSHTTAGTLRVLYIGMRYDYGDPRRGECYEYRNMFGTLQHMAGVQAEFFAFDVLLRERGRAAMNRALEDRVRSSHPDVCFFALFTDEIDRRTIERISGMTATVNWFADDHWRFDGFSRFWAPSFHSVVTTDRDSVSRYHHAGIRNVILSQWAFNHFVPGNDGASQDLGVTFVGQVHSTRQALVHRLQREGIDVKAWGKGWPAGRLGGGDLATLYARSAINLNFSESSVVLDLRSVAKIFISRRADDSMHLRGIRAMAGHARHVLRRPRPQIKGRTFEVPGAGGFLLTGAAEHLDSYLVPGKEVAVFHDADELVERTRYYLSNPEEREAVRRAGHERVLREHTYEQRFLVIFKEMGLHADVQ